MRIPLPRIAWWLGGEPTTTTNVDGSVDGPVQSGNFSGPVQTVHVTVPPPAPPPDTATHGDRIRFITAALMHMQSEYVTDRKERYERQALADAQHNEAQEARTLIWQSLIFLGTVLALDTFVIVYMFFRLGWLW